MDMGTAIKTCYQKYFTFSGRATRSEFWYFYLFYLFVYAGINILVAFALDNQKFEINYVRESTVAFITFFVVGIPSFTASFRRIHDTGRSGWWFLIILTGIGVLIYLYFLCARSDPKSNAYGSPYSNIGPHRQRAIRETIKNKNMGYDKIEWGLMVKYNITFAKCAALINPHGDIAIAEFLKVYKIIGNEAMAVKIAADICKRYAPVPRKDIEQFKSYPVNFIYRGIDVRIDGEHNFCFFIDGKFIKVAGLSNVEPAIDQHLKSLAIDIAKQPSAPEPVVPNKKDDEIEFYISSEIVNKVVDDKQRIILAVKGVPHCAIIPLSDINKLESIP